MYVYTHTYIYIYSEYILGFAVFAVAGPVHCRRLCHEAKDLSLRWGSVWPGMVVVCAIEFGFYIDFAADAPTAGLSGSC